MQDTAEGIKTNSGLTFTFGSLPMDMSVFGDQQKLSYNSSVRTLDVVWKT